MKFGFTLRERQTIYLEIVSAESNAMQAAIDKYGHKPRDLDPFAYAVKFHDYFDTELARRMDDILTRYDITKQKASLIVQEGKDGGWPTTKLDPRRTQN